MLFKVFYQEYLTEVPTRESTKSLFFEADSIQDVRRKLADRKYNIEYIQEVTGEFLEYEKQSNQFEVENG
jgi:DNA-dependent RNA polymerase auxiliary subunit epsilon